MESSDNGPAPTSVLFVCLGNICRSPLAEGVFKHLLEAEGLSNRFIVDSAGTGGWHVGEPPDSRAAYVAESHGITLDSHARQVQSEDTNRFDILVAMDHENLRNLERMASEEEGSAEIHLLREWDPEKSEGDEVPDPYYGGPTGFENVYRMIHRSCEGLLEHLRSGAWAG